MNNKTNQSPTIAFFTSSMGDGGAQRTVANLVRGFAELGYSVDLVLIDPNGPYLDTLPKEVNVVDFNVDRAITTIPSLAIYLSRNDPDIFFSTIEYLNVVALISYQLSASEATTIIRTASVRSAHDIHTPKQQIQYRLAKRLYPRADQLIALSNYVKDDMQSHYQLRDRTIEVIYNPVNISEIQSLAQQKPDHEVFYSDSEVIVNVGRFNEEKDILTTVRAFAQVVPERDVELLLLGKGPQKEKLTELATDLDIKERVHMPGFVDNPFRYVHSSDVFVLSSRWEGFGNVLVEAMACGTPVVATNCPGGPSEILDEGTYGNLVPVGDEKALASAIERTLDDPLDESTLIDRALDFDYEDITDQYKKAMRSINK